jgi:hypothetical protein
MEFSSTPIWIQIHDMPLGCMNRVVGGQIGSSLGEVEDVAVAEDDVGWGRYLRIRVAINLYHPLERGRTLLISGKSCWVSFKYEKLPIFCFRCGCIIHGPNGCAESTMRKNHLEGSEGWGLWLRAEDLTKGPGRTEDTKMSPVFSDQGPAEGEKTKDQPEEEGEQSAEDPVVSSVTGMNPDGGIPKSSRLDVAGLPNGERVEELKASKKRKSSLVSESTEAPVFEKGAKQGNVDSDEVLKKGRVSKDSNVKGGPKWVQSHLGPTEKRKSKKVDSSKDPAHSLLLNRKIQEVFPNPFLSREVKQSTQVVGPSPEELETRPEVGNKLKEWKRIARGSPKVAKGEDLSPLRGAIDNPEAFERYESLAVGADSVLAVAGLQPRQSP